MSGKFWHRYVTAASFQSWTSLVFDIIKFDILKTFGVTEDPETPRHLRGDRGGGMSPIYAGVPLGSLVMKPRDRNDYPISV